MNEGGGDGETDEFCNPLTMNYNKIANAQTVTGLLNEEINFICKQANGGDTCEAKICIIETSFMRDYFQLANTYFKLPDSTTFKHEYGFDPDVECVKPNKNRLAAIYDSQCCGDFVSGRKPFFQQAGMLECCDNGDIRALGTCF